MSVDSDKDIDVKSRYLEACGELERGIHSALETYSNVHRGAGHFSIISTELFEYARFIVLDYLQLDKNQYVVVFCTPFRLKMLKKTLKSADYQILVSNKLGLPLGLIAIAIKKSMLSKSEAFQTGGGIVKYVTSHSVVWAEIPTRFEAGTPSIINIIIFAKILQLFKEYGEDFYKSQTIKATHVVDMLYQDEFSDYTGTNLMTKLRKSYLGQNINVPTIYGENPYINFDNAASTPTFSPIWELVCHMLKQPKLNKKDIIKEVKQICADFLGAPMTDYEIIFTSNTTEAINIAARNLSLIGDGDKELVVVNTLLEHHSNELPWRYISKANLIRISVDNNGFVNLSELENVLLDYNRKHKYGKKRVNLVAISGASNVLGTFNDLEAIGSIIKKHGANFLVDGAQLVAHRNVQIAKTGIDYLAFSGHKMYAPFGCGVLIIKKELINLKYPELAEIKHSGEENIIGIAALGKAILLLKRIGMDIIEKYEKNLTQKTIKGLKNIPKIKILGIQSIRSPNFAKKGGILCFNLKNIPHNLTAKYLAEYGGIGVRSGCFCAHLLVKHILRIHPIRKLGAKLVAMLFPKLSINLLPGLVRISFGIENDEDEVDHFLNVLKVVSQRRLSWGNKILAYTNNATPYLPASDIERQINQFGKASARKVYSTFKNN